MISIIDYDAGNIRSVEKALAFLGEEIICTGDPKVILNSDKVVLPGVGSYGSAMNSLRRSGLIPVIKEVCSNNIPFLGICLGYQLLFDGSEEEGGVEGLSIFPGDVVRFPKTKGFTIPQIGWNSLSVKKNNKLYKDIPNETFVYFVHSYYVKSKNRDIVASTTDYIVEYDSSIESENIYGCQFHPEKSSEKGLHILKNFCE